MNRELLFLTLLLCSSCSSIYRFSIEIQEPAPVTIPVSAQNVLILNNTVTQPKDFGIERTFDGQSIRTDYPLSLDSMSWSAIDEIAAVFEESKFFNTIAVYREPIRTDSEWFSITPLSPEIQLELYDTEDYDALFVIERLLFSIDENVKKTQQGALTPESNIFVDMYIGGILTCSIYSFEKERPITTINVSDSIGVKTTFVNDSTLLFKFLPEHVLDVFSRSLGNQAAKHFIPTWKTSERQLFVSFNPRMQEAAGYAADYQWENAELVWVAELEKKTKPVDMAKIAFNLAVTNEMRDKFDSALEWAQKAKGYLKDVDKDKNSQEIEFTDKYISELERRIQNNQLLDLQWGKE